MGRVELAQEDADGRDVQRGQVELVHLQMKREMWKSVKPYEKVVPGECFSLMSYVVLGYAFQQRGWWWWWPWSCCVFLWSSRRPTGRCSSPSSRATHPVRCGRLCRAHG